MLQEILTYKREEVAERRRRVPLGDLVRRARDAPTPRSFGTAVRGSGIRLVAEVKGASPSAGVIRSGLDPVGVAKAYERGGAAAVSVLTDARYFHGSDEHLRAIRNAVALPILRKDFIVDAYQIYEARVLGADAVLLIVSALEPGLLIDLQGVAAELGMAALVEVHSEVEVARALEARALLVGINNRDLGTMETNLDVTRRLRPHLPPAVTVVSESGVETRAHVGEMERLGVHAVLVGTALMRAPDPASKIRELLGTPV